MVKLFPLRQPSDPIEAMKGGKTLEESLRQWHRTFSSEELHEHIQALSHSCTLVPMPLNQQRITLMRQELDSRLREEFGY